MVGACTCEMVRRMTCWAVASFPVDEKTPRGWRPASPRTPKGRVLAHFFGYTCWLWGKAIRLGEEWCARRGVWRAVERALSTRVASSPLGRHAYMTGPVAQRPMAAAS